jgi:trehalose 6-phosphate synthase/phosphatase
MQFAASITLRSKFSWYDRGVHDCRQSKCPADTDVHVTRVRRDENAQPTEVRLLLDYDGTLVPIARSPELAVPDDELLALLDALAGRLGLRVGIVSGRAHLDLDSWLGHLPIELWAEHGFWHRSRPGDRWEAACSVPDGWMQRIAPILSQITASTPGSYVERKTASMAWHYRLAEPVLVARRMRTLRTRLDHGLRDQPFDVLEGKKVIEVRLPGVSKALVAERIAPEVSPATSIVAIGDDRTDEELFCALPESSVTVAVGNQRSSAKYRLADYRGVRRILRAVLDDPQLVTTSFLAGADREGAWSSHSRGIF